MEPEEQDDEVLFWQGMIDWWETSNSEPVPKRMRDALTLARSKARLIEKYTCPVDQTVH